MKIIALGAAAAIALASPAFAASAPAAEPKLDDFACMVRTLYMAGAAEDSARKATDATARENAQGVSLEAYEAASYFIGRLTLSKGTIISKARFDAEIAGLAQLPQDGVAQQIAQCTGRAKSERAAFISPLSGK
ncbi:MAG: hypothetical protein ACKOQM_15735 [Novosphingobium sp.]